ncbi:MAG TPA: peptidoglycan-binding protein [Acidimicrobiales bacterium]|nr:peptidoglycan-binding protein [Acidimicrobiales bacterium]
MRAGDSGDAVADLQRRLGDQGLPTLPDPPALFGPGTRASVEAFQHRRGLRVDGACGSQTWNALVEAGFRLGDRFLYNRRPMFRGDDVADLQRRLSSLGFDSGRVDGIFGDLTASALGDFQRNLGLPVDGIVGAATLRELLRVMPPHGDLELVSVVRDRERLRQAPRTLADRRIAVGHEGGLDVLVAAVRRQLVREGAVVIALVHPDGSALAASANTADVEVYLGFRLDPSRSHCTAAYYAGFRYESEGGRRLAELLQDAVARALGVPGDGAIGMSLPVLRETRMPAVICEVGPANTVVQQVRQVGEAVVEALSAWALTPLD